ncbi:hypothetical protein [Idiomarina piscisalsi]|uniref:hypothetical protein n=1 Tax=Idiomarina piscisalsi TaxID=1096243 RepID=UPI001384958D|nr:hypothetical protein [Idiomarina piscisalsi]MTJ02664.1 hypothetical protein [Idiomarina piscisalsi]
MKDNIFRVIYIILCVVIVYLSYLYYGDVVSDKSLFKKFSYIGTVVTTTGFIVAAFEVVHSVYVSKSIHRQSKELLMRVKEVESASTISDCISAIDETNRHVMSEDYTASLCSFQGFRKLFVKLDVDISHDKDLLNRVEKLMFKSTKTSSKAPLSKPQKDKLISEILEIKVTLEKSSPANGSK